MYMDLNYFIKIEKISTKLYTVYNHFILINIIIKWEKSQSSALILIVKGS